MVINGIIDFGTRASRESLVGSAVTGFLLALHRGKIYVLLTHIFHTIEVLITARADGGEVQIVYFVRRVGFLMPGLLVTMAKGDKVGERVVIINYEGKAAHGLVSIICGYAEGSVGIGVCGDDVYIGGPV